VDITTFSCISPLFCCFNFYGYLESGSESEESESSSGSEEDEDESKSESEASTKTGSYFFSPKAAVFFKYIPMLVVFYKALLVSPLSLVYVKQHPAKMHNACFTLLHLYLS